MTSLSAIGGSDVHVCHRCLMPSTRPRIVFDENGVCNGCLNADAKDSIDWDARKAEFEQLVEENRPARGTTTASCRGAVGRTPAPSRGG